MALLNASFQEVRLVAEVGARAEIELKHMNEKLEQAKTIAVVAEAKVRDKDGEIVVLKETLEVVRGELAAAKESAVHWENTCHKNGVEWKAYCDDLKKQMMGSPEGEET